MFLNANNIKNFVDLGEFGKLAQVGIDLSVTNITQIIGGKLYKGGRKEIDEYQEVDSYSDNGIKTWILEAGKVYSLTFEQKVKLDDKHCAIVIGKSTTSRVGLYIKSCLFDPCFESTIGATMYCFSDDVEIQEGAMLAQFVIAECEEAEAYNGSYQGEKDLK